jgi:pimeloyl-ACP methyl ester carboxylesterase
MAQSPVAFDTMAIMPAQPTDHLPATYRVPGLVLTEHTLEVPLDHTDPSGRQISVFARVAADPDGLDRPFLLFLQGGPGFEAPRPIGTPLGPGWLARALTEFRVVMLDQRGTGRSTPVGDLPDLTPAEQAAYLTHFRADEIVRDAEAMRAHLDSRPWSCLGQSFGGFATLAYLSQAPEGLREAFFTGGLPALGAHIDDVYQATYARVIERTRRYYTRYPGDRDRVLAACEMVRSDRGLVLPSGDRASVSRIRQLGHLLGSSDGAEQLHYILELDPGSPAFRHDVEAATSWARNPIYAILHEACWANGFASRWSAQRILPAEYADDPTLFTGEHVYPWMFEEISALAPLRAAADLLAEQPWPQLYDAARLAANDVPAAAAIYAEDMYVERSFSEQTAAMVGGLHPWVTNEYEHNGLRADGDRVLDRLINLARGRA